MVNKSGKSLRYRDSYMSLLCSNATAIEFIVFGHFCYVCLTNPNSRRAEVGNLAISGS
jgi:hypothetical protein